MMSGDSIPVYIAHASWAIGRDKTLARLLRQLEPQDCKVTVVRSELKEHANVWAVRLWERASQTEHTGKPVVFLNDDVEVSPDLVSASRSIVCEHPHPMVSLHTQFPTAQFLADLGQKYVESYWLSGPGYILSLDAIDGLLDFVQLTPKNILTRWNEDGWANLYAWSQREPILHPIPALVKHDTNVSSTLGYDKHPHRNASITWDDPMFFGRDLAGRDFWRGHSLFVECPWMPEPALRFWSATRQIPDGICCLCVAAPGRVGPLRSGLTICEMCLRASAEIWNQHRKQGESK